MEVRECPTPVLLNELCNHIGLFAAFTKLNAGDLCTEDAAILADFRYLVMLGGSWL